MTASHLRRLHAPFKSQKQLSHQEKSIMINSVMKYHEPQMNADKRRFIVPAISSYLVLIDANRQNNHFFAPFAYFEVKNRIRSIIFWFENHREHRGHREKWQSSALSVYSVVDCLCEYSFFQKKLKNLSNSANHGKLGRKLLSNIFDDILKVGVNL